MFCSTKLSLRRSLTYNFLQSIMIRASLNADAPDGRLSMVNFANLIFSTSLPDLLPHSFNALRYVSLKNLN